MTTSLRSRLSLKQMTVFKQIYAKQQRDLQFLHVHLESSQELTQKHEKAARDSR